MVPLRGSWAALGDTGWWQKVLLWTVQGSEGGAGEPMPGRGASGGRQPWWRPECLAEVTQRPSHPGRVVCWFQGLNLMHRGRQAGWAGRKGPWG